MRHDIRIENEIVNITLNGSMYAIDAANLRDTVQDLIRGGNTKFSFDLSALDYMDSTGLGLFIFIDEELKAKGGKVTLNGLTGRVKTLFERTRLYDVFVTK